MEKKVLTWLEDRAHITDLIHRYAFNIRNRRGGECGALFTEDGTFEVREMIAGDPASLKTRTHLPNRAAIVKYLTEGQAASVTPCPVLHNILINVRGNIATSTAIMRTIMFSDIEGVVGEYHDSYAKTGWVWLFTSRIFTILKAKP